MVLFVGQTVIPGGAMARRFDPVMVLVSMLATLPLTSEAEVRLGHCAPAPKLKLFWRRRSLKHAEAAAQSRLPIAKQVVRKADAGLREVLGGRESGVRAGAGVADQPQRFRQHRHGIAH